MRNTIFAKAYPDRRALEPTESENASLKNITGGMLRAATASTWASGRRSRTRRERAKARWNPGAKDLFGDEASPTAPGSDGLVRKKGRERDLMNAASKPGARIRRRA